MGYRTCIKKSRAMKIYTKKGDSGQTGLIGGNRVSKSDLRISTYGTIDELNAFIGLLRDLIKKSKHSSQLIEIQDRLFTAGSILAVGDNGTKMNLPAITQEDISNLEYWIDEMDEILPEMNSFILPGGHVNVSYCHVARTICRRAERSIVELSLTIDIDPLLLSYFNRLSDFLFTLSRSLAHDLNIKEIPWNSKK